MHLRLFEKEIVFNFEEKKKRCEGHKAPRFKDTPEKKTLVSQLAPGDCHMKDNMCVCDKLARQAGYLHQK